MTYEEIMSELAAMKSHFDGGFSISERTRIVEMYKLYLGKSINNLSCSDCYRDAFIEITNYLKKLNKLPMFNYKLKNGHYLHVFGSAEYHFNPITDETAEKFLKEHPDAISEFETFPEDWKSRIKEKPAKNGKGGRKKKVENAPEAENVPETENAPEVENDVESEESDEAQQEAGVADNVPQAETENEPQTDVENERN